VRFHWEHFEEYIWEHIGDKKKSQNDPYGSKGMNKHNDHTL
jgi:hypothetical protein